MEVMLITTMSVVGASFFAFFLYVKGQSVKGRISGTGSIRVKDPALSDEQAEGFFHGIMLIPWRGSSKDLPQPEALAPAVSASLPETALAAERPEPAALVTHERLVPLARQLAAEVWPEDGGHGDSYLRSLPYKDFSPEQIAALMPHHAALRLYAVTDASYSVGAFRSDHEAFGELLDYFVMRNCGDEALARRIAMGVQKYARNRASIFERGGDEVVSAQLTGVFWSGVFADCPDFFDRDDAGNFHFAFSMACDFTSRYNAVLSQMETHCGIKLKRAPLTIVLPSEDRGFEGERPKGELIFSPEDGLYEISTGSFHDLLDWIEDTEQYRSLYEETLDQPGVDACYFCSGDASAAETVELTNGWKVHKRCCDMLIGRLVDLKTVQASRELFKLSPNLLCAHRLVNTYWPGTPPDWKNRLQTIFARAEGECENCGRAGMNLEVVHVVPTELGGNHACDNLLCLCQECRAQHNLHIESEADGEWKGLYHVKLQQIDQALTEGRKLLFSYREKETRVISPREWAKKRGYWLVKGYCYYHNDERLFNPRRMTDLKIL